MTTPTDYSTTVWDHLVSDLGQPPSGPDVLPWTPFADVPSEVGE